MKAKKPLLPGAVLLGRYKLEKILSANDATMQFAAHDSVHDRRVVVKILSGAGMQESEARARLAREGQALCKLQSPHVVHAFDSGLLDDQTPYLVSEFLEGQTLAQYLVSSDRLPLKQAVDWVLQACDGLQDVHARGFFHRDIKSSNLFLAEQPDGSQTLKIIDFGVAKVQGVELTADGEAVGSPCYMAPEQMRNARNVDARADIWSLGVVLYELLGGVRPFQSKTLAALVLEVAQDEPTPLRELRPELPPALEAAVQCCLAKKASERFASVAELKKALLPFSSGAGQASGASAPEVPAPMSAHSALRAVAAQLPPLAAPARPDPAPVAPQIAEPAPVAPFARPAQAPLRSDTVQLSAQLPADWMRTVVPDAKAFAALRWGESAAAAPAPPATESAPAERAEPAARTDEPRGEAPLRAKPHRHDAPPPRVAALDNEPSDSLGSDSTLRALLIVIAFSVLLIAACAYVFFRH